MSDHAVSILPCQSTFPNRKEKAKEILNWLISKDVVKSQPSKCLLGINDHGYAVSEGAKKVVKEPQFLPFRFAVNGLEIITERRVYAPVGSELEKIVCPHCKRNILPAFDWEVVDDWYHGITNNITCPVCHSVSEINQYDFEEDWGLSDLGFSFWNWPEFTSQFLEEFRQKFNSDIKVIHSHL